MSGESSLSQDNAQVQIVVLEAPSGGKTLARINRASYPAEDLEATIGRAGVRESQRAEPSLARVRPIYD